VFRGLINNAKSAASSLVLKYVARASVAVPFVIAAGFALAAGTVMLVERYGQIYAYLSMAAGLTAVGLIATLFVREKENQEDVADERAEARDTAEVATEVAAQAPHALLGGRLAMPGGPCNFIKVVDSLDPEGPISAPDNMAPARNGGRAVLVTLVALIGIGAVGAAAMYFSDTSQARALLVRIGLVS
jgi:hypothetical protein